MNEWTDGLLALIGFGIYLLIRITGEINDNLKQLIHQTRRDDF